MHPAPASGVAERIGILGGTFDPVHVGHLVAAISVREELALDYVLLVVANDPWQKTGTGPITPAEDRYAVVAAAVENVPGLLASRLEIDRGGPSYTADTIRALRAANPAAELFLVVGTDAAAELGTWHRVEGFVEEVTLAVVERPGASSGPDLTGWRVHRIATPGLEISSSDLRQRLAGARNVDFLIPEAAIRCIRRRGLYASTR
ncbi:MAG: nicotinate-nucleotide adenylyltransferase [Acidimicrobiales bacterium]